MNILINASNLKVGGGIQVADSICRELYKYSEHSFFVVLSSNLSSTRKSIEKYTNVNTYEYNIRNNVSTLVFGRDKYLDGLVRENHIDAVLTVFGPSRWNPKCPHLSGFAVPHLVIPESPFFMGMKGLSRLKKRILYVIITIAFRRSADHFFTENPFISARLENLLKGKTVYTITNNANQIFQHPMKWDKSIELPRFKGLTMLTVTANYPHKNLHIVIPTCKYLEERHPDLNFRFVLTIKEGDLKGLNDSVRRHIVFLGPVRINHIPFLYEQSDVMFLPTLLECFSASYAEAMVMRRPILTTDLEFARGLCGDAALYFEPTSPEALGEAIVKLSADTSLRDQLIINGLKQLEKFDTFDQRAEKLIRIVESLVK